MAQPVFASTNITTNTTTTIKSGPGVLGGVTINTKGTAANTATLFDSTTGSGTKIGTIDTTSAQGTLLYDILFVNGLTITTATGGAADLTVEWY